MSTVLACVYVYWYRGQVNLHWSTCFLWCIHNLVHLTLHYLNYLLPEVPRCITWICIIQRKCIYSIGMCFCLLMWGSDTVRKMLLMKYWLTAWFQTFAAMYVRSALSWDFTQHTVVIRYGRFRTPCSETSVRNYHSMLRNVTEERRSQPTLFLNSVDMQGLVPNWGRFVAHASGLLWLLQIHNSEKN